MLPGCCDLAKVPEEMWMIDDAWSPYGSVLRLFISMVGQKEMTLEPLIGDISLMLKTP